MRKDNKMSFWIKFIIGISFIGMVSSLTSNIQANEQKTQRQYSIPGHGVLKLKKGPGSNLDY